MLTFTLTRMVNMTIVLFIVAVLTFIIIQLPPGDYLTTMMARMAEGGNIDHARIDALRLRFGLDDPWHVQFWSWFTNMLRGDFGWSFEWGQPVSQLVWDRLGMTLALSVSSLALIWLIAIPVGVYSAVRQYSAGDYAAQVLGYIGLATPNFMLALVLMWFSFDVLGFSVGGLFSPEYRDAPWSWGKFLDFLTRIWIPIVVIATAGTAGLIRVMRANMLDELRKPYVETARAKGLSWGQLLPRYPLRLALNPFVSTIGWILPTLISGEAIVSVVLNLPTAGPLLLRALMSQDMYLAGSIIMLLSVLVVIGTVISDVLLAWLDPRIRYD